MNLDLLDILTLSFWNVPTEFVKYEIYRSVWVLCSDCVFCNTFMIFWRDFICVLVRVYKQIDQTRDFCYCNIMPAEFKTISIWNERGFEELTERIFELMFRRESYSSAHSFIITLFLSNISLIIGWNSEISLRTLLRRINPSFVLY